MTEAQHTPGPWHTETYNEPHTLQRVSDKDGLIADLHSEDNAAADANLIAAAPAMLDAAAHALAHLRAADWTPGQDEAVTVLVEAINKAKGNA